jgi:hypothetical protein
MESIEKFSKAEGIDRQPWICHRQDNKRLLADHAESVA